MSIELRPTRWAISHTYSEGKDTCDICKAKNEVKVASVAVLDLTKSNTTYTAKGSGGNSLSGYSTTWTATSKTNTSYSWTIKNFNQNNGGWAYIRAGSNGSIATNFAIAQKITQIKITVLNAKTGTATLEYSTNSDFTSATELTIDITQGVTSLEFDISSAIANGYYRITFKYSNTKQIDVSKVDYWGY